MATSKKSWKDVLQEIKTLLSRGRKNLFQVVKKSVELYEDREFREEHGLLSDKAVEKWFSKNLFSDYGLNFLELRAVYKEHSSESDWKENTISELYEMVQENVEEPVKGTRKTTSYKKEAEELKVELKEANQKIKSLEDIIVEKDKYIKKLESQISEFNGENEELKIAYAKLEGKLEVMRRPAA